MDRGKMIYTELNGIRYGKSYGVFYRYLHRRLWNWLADTHGRKYKKDWPEWAINGGIVPMAESYCFACAATDKCSNCPIDQESPAVKAVEQDNERNYNEFRELEKNPEYKPFKMRTIYPWRELHDEIFNLIRAGMIYKDVAAKVGVPPENLNGYVSRYKVRS